MSETWWYDAVDGRVRADREVFRTLIVERDRLAETLAERDAQVAALREAMEQAVSTIESSPRIGERASAAMTLLRRALAAAAPDAGVSPQSFPTVP